MKLNEKMMSSVFGRHDVTGKKMVLLCIAALKDNDTGECNPSIRELAAMVGISKPTVDVAIRDLKSLGLISVTRRYAIEGRGRATNNYNIHI